MNIHITSTEKILWTYIAYISYHKIINNSSILFFQLCSQNPLYSKFKVIFIVSICGFVNTLNSKLLILNKVLSRVSNFIFYFKGIEKL